MATKTFSVYECPEEELAKENPLWTFCVAKLDSVIATFTLTDGRTVEGEFKRYGSRVRLPRLLIVGDDDMLHAYHLRRVVARDLRIDGDQNLAVHAVGLCPELQQVIFTNEKGRRILSGRSHLYQVKRVVIDARP